LVFQAAEAGDQVAKDTIHWAGEELADMINGVARQLNYGSEEFEIVMIGSTFKGGPLLIDPMQKAVKEKFPLAKFFRLEAPPVVGAILLAMGEDLRTNPEIRKKLVNTVRLAVS
jgi:N-acetylglucosamine kinase-like BadF-type ATPase